MKVNEAITEVMKLVGAVGKDSVNQQQRFNFRGVDATVNALSPAMRKHGLTVRPSGIISREYEHFQSKSGAQGVACRMVVQFTFTGPEGDSVESVVAAEANDYGDKATPKCMSVAFRTCLLQTFALPTDEADPDEHTYEPQAPAPQKDFIKLVESAPTRDAAKGVWEQARAAGAPQDYLDQIAQIGQGKPEAA